MNKYYIIAILSMVLSVVLFIFNFYQTKIGGVIFALSIGASIKVLADGILNESKQKNTIDFEVNRRLTKSYLNKYCTQLCKNDSWYTVKVKEKHLRVSAFYYK
ncbi:TPA: hypothetical protein QCY16_005688 [Bacillus cereus]|nr:hypothetical protein [Bacillus cereus]